MPIVRVKENVFKEVEKMLKYRFWDKERERSQRAAAMVVAAQGTKRHCLPGYMITPTGKIVGTHGDIAWSGPPHDPIRAYICLTCQAAACEPEIKDRGFDFDTVPDWIIFEILDLDLARQGTLGNQKTFGGFNGNAGKR